MKRDNFFYAVAQRSVDATCREPYNKREKKAKKIARYTKRDNEMCRRMIAYYSDDLVECVNTLREINALHYDKRKIKDNSKYAYLFNVLIGAIIEDLLLPYNCSKITVE